MCAPPRKHSSRVRWLLTTVAFCVWFRCCRCSPHVRACVGVLLQAAGQQGDTAPPPPEQDVDLHFIAFVEHHGEEGGLLAAAVCCLLVHA